MDDADAAGQLRSSVRPKSDFIDHSARFTINYLENEREMRDRPLFPSLLVLTGLKTAFTPSRTTTPCAGSQLTWTPMPCQSASKSLCGASNEPSPDCVVHGRSLTNGVRFSVHTFSAGRDACRRW
jgi:hypothetical protein